MLAPRARTWTFVGFDSPPKLIPDPSSVAAILTFGAPFELISRIPDECIAVSESGLRTHDHLVKLRAAGFDAFLVGTHLMLSPDPAAALSALLNSPPGTL